MRESFVSDGLRHHRGLPEIASSVRLGRVALSLRPHLVDPVPLRAVLDEYLTQLDAEERGAA